MEAPNRIKLTNFPKEQYIAEETLKKQIVIHHTCGGSALSSVDGWIKDPKRIATHLVIDRDGLMLQQFSSKFWAYHLGLKEETFRKYHIPYQSIDKISLSIELANYGEVKKHSDGKWYNEYGGLLKGKTCFYNPPFKGISNFEAYTNEQIESLRQILLYWGEKYNIPLNYNDKMWNLNVDALKGTPGIWTHVSYRETGKSDCHPQDNLITMLKNLK